MIRVVMADDQALVLAGLAAILRSEADIDVVGQGRNGREAVELARSERPDVVVLDIRMPELDGIEATRLIVAAPDAPRVLILTTFDLDSHVYDAMRAGASGFLLKDAPPGRLAQAVRDVGTGEVLIDAAVARRLIERFARLPPPGPELPPALADLSDREVGVLREVAAGRSNQEIAERLHLSPATVKTHVATILRKLGARDRIQLVVHAYESGLVTPGDRG